MPTNTVQAVSPYYNPTIEEVSTVPNIKSAKKRVKVAAAKTLQNKMINSQLKTEIKKANVAIESTAQCIRRLLSGSRFAFYGTF